MIFPCRCILCDYPADGEDGKCKSCRDEPDAWLPCRFRSDEEYRELLMAQ